MTTAREIMTPGVAYIGEDLTVEQAALKMDDESFGMLPVCGSDGHLRGVITDSDIVLRVVAQGKDPSTTRVAEITDGAEVVTIGADDSVEEAIATMKRHSVRRLPVIDGRDMVGMVSQADIARALPDARVGDLIESISSTAPNN
jgi:CBS domain-containing protein